MREAWRLTSTSATVALLLFLFALLALTAASAGTTPSPAAPAPAPARQAARRPETKAKATPPQKSETEQEKALSIPSSPKELLKLPVQTASKYLRSQRLGGTLGFQALTYARLYRPDAQHADLRSTLQLWSTKTSTKYFVCLVPGAGSTQWIDVILQTVLPAPMVEKLKKETGPFAFHLRSFPGFGFFHRPPALATPNAANAGLRKRHMKISQQVINNPSIFKFAVVRHPWPRAVSNFYTRYVVNCKRGRFCFAQKYRLSSLVDGTKNDHDPVTFHEFAQALADAVEHQETLHPYFRPASVLCETDRIPYTYIAEIGNDAEMDYLSLKIGSNIPFSQRAREASRGPGDADGAGAQQHHGDESNVAGNEGSWIEGLAFPCMEGTVRLVQQVYEADLEAFEYHMVDAYKSCRVHGLTAPPHDSAK